MVVSGGGSDRMADTTDRIAPGGLGGGVNSIIKIITNTVIMKKKINGLKLIASDHIAPEGLVGGEGGIN